MMQKMIDDDFKGRVFSIMETMAMALMPLGGSLDFYTIYSRQKWILIVSSLLLIGVVLVLARPSVVRKAHPELGNVKRIDCGSKISTIIIEGVLVMEKIFQRNCPHYEQ